MTEPSISAPALAVEASRTAELDDGLAILDSNGEAMAAAGRGDWVDGGLGLGLAGLDTLGTVLDPFGALLSNGVGWVMAHVDPLPEMLDAVAGDPGEIEAMAATWANVSARLSDTADLYADFVTSDVLALAGPALTSYRAYADKEAELLRGLSSSVRGVGDSVQTAGAVVGAVRGVVQELLCTLVSKLISSALQLVMSGGTATPWVVAEITATVSRCTSTVAEWLRRLVDSVVRLSALLRVARARLDDLADCLGAVRRWADDTGVAQSAIFDDGLVAGPGTLSVDVRQYGLHAVWTGAKHATTGAQGLDDPPGQG